MSSELSPKEMTLHNAVCTGRLTALRARIAASESIETRDDDGRTPLMIAVEMGRIDALRALIEAGSMLDAATVLSEPDPSRRPLAPGVKAISRLGLLELIGPIVGGQAAVKARRKNQNGPTALMIAAAAGHAEAVHDLLAAGASPSLRDCDGFPALSHAAALGHAAIVHALVLAGAEIDPIDQFDMTPITLAALNGHAEAIHELAGAGARLSATKPMAFSPLHAAAHYGHTKAVRALLTAGADVNAKVYNDTPLGMALAKGRAERRQVDSEDADLSTLNSCPKLIKMKTIVLGPRGSPIIDHLEVGCVDFL